MSVSVLIPTNLRALTGGEKRVSAEGSTLAEVIGYLESSYAGLFAPLLDPADPGNLRRFVNIYVNDKDVRLSGGLQTPIADGDSLTILVAMAGG